MTANRRVLWLAITLASLWSAGAAAQQRPPQNSCLPGPDLQLPAQCNQVALTVPFDTLPPGARALGLGGAFAAVADDATAAEANPAGQIILTRPEVSIHGRHADYNVPFVNPDLLEGAPFGASVGNGFSEYEDANSTVSFASFVYPFEHFVLSGYYHNAGKLDVGTSDALFDPGFIDTYVASTLIDVEQDSAGLSGAFRVNDMLSIGASVKYARLDLTYAAQSALLDFRDQENGSLANAATITDLQSLTTAAAGDDSDITWNVGLLLNPNGKVSAGLVYKEGGSFKFDTALRFVSQFNCNGAAGCTGNPVDVSRDFGFGKTRVDLPDVLSLGIAARPSDTWLLSLQFDRIDYSDLPAPRASSLIFAVPTAPETIDAAITTHFGVEKTFLFDAPVLGMSLLSVRGGAFNDRDHDGFAALKTNDTHYTFGVGTVFFDDLQIDVGAEWSDKIDDIVLSAVYRF